MESSRQNERKRFAGMIGRESLRSQVRDVILQRILTGDLPPGEPINLADTAEELGVSRTPLREALLGLTEQGLVGLGERNQGFYVWPLTLSEVENLGRICATLESLAVRLTEPMGSRLIEEMRSVNRALADARGDTLEMIECNDRWHELLVSRVDNPELVEMIDQVRKRLYRYRWYGHEYVARNPAETRFGSPEQHDAITDALEAGAIDRAARLTEEHCLSGVRQLARWLPQEGALTGRK